MSKRVEARKDLELIELRFQLVSSPASMSFKSVFKTFKSVGESDKVLPYILCFFPSRGGNNFSKGREMEKQVQPDRKKFT